MQLSAGTHCYLRIASVETTLSRCLTESLAPAWLGATVYLGGVPFRVRTVADHDGDHPQAGTLSYVALADKVKQYPPPSGLDMRFLTPTTFRRSPQLDGPFGDDPYDVPLPLPELAFGGLLEMWNTFAPQPLPEDMDVFVRDCVVVSRYRLHTELVSFGSGRRGRVGGFVGECRFAIRCGDEAWRQRVGFLAAFAPFAGVGWRTTVGLGQVTLVE
jgi:CRISPR-associated endoribonuclease Cas6